MRLRIFTNQTLSAFGAWLPNLDGNEEATPTASGRTLTVSSVLCWCAGGGCARHLVQLGCHGGQAIPLLFGFSYQRCQRMVGVHHLQRLQRKEEEHHIHNYRNQKKTFRLIRKYRRLNTLGSHQP